MQSAIVIGLLPPQAQKVAEDFPGAQLKFLPRDRERETGDVAQSFDKVIVMTKFISHSVWNAIPKEKLVPVNGGMSELRRKLAALVPTLRRELKKPTVAAEYSAIRDAEPGSVLVFECPHGTTKETFWKQIMAVRSYYKKRWNIETEQRQGDKGVEVVVNGIPPRAQLTAAPAAAPASTASTVPAELAQLWSDAYLRLITAAPGASDEILAARADAAIAAFRARFPSA